MNVHFITALLKGVLPMKKADLLSGLRTDAVSTINQTLADVQSMISGYNPIAPHLQDSTREDSSKFNDAITSWETFIDFVAKYTADPDRYFKLIDKGDAVIVTFYANTVIGKESHCFATGDGPWEVVDGGHGPMAKGPGIKVVYPTNIVTIIFTNEGEDNFVAATVHPGKDEEPGDYSGLSIGDQLTLEDIINRRINRVIPN